jgi:decaprenylphospho-beta-D-ribofuranose 2-oxidase
MADPKEPTDVFSGWGRVAPSGAERLRPEDSDAVGTAFDGAGARGVVARGLGRSYGDAAQNAGGRVLETNRLSGVVDFDMETGRVTALAGTSLEEIIGKFLPWGWFPAVVPGTKFVTVGGAIAADIHGKNHHVDGSFCDAVESFELWCPSGGLSRVSAKQNSDVFGATAGGMGLTGVITQATFRLRKVHTAFLRADTYRADDIDEPLARALGDHAAHQLVEDDSLKELALGSGRRCTFEIAPAKRAGIDRPLRRPRG